MEVQKAVRKGEEEREEGRRVKRMEGENLTQEDFYQSEKTHNAGNGRSISVQKPGSDSCGFIGTAAPAAAVETEGLGWEAELVELVGVCHVGYSALVSRNGGVIQLCT